MGPGVVILFWLIVLGVVGALWLGLVALAVVGWQRRIAWLKWTAGIPAALMAAGGLTLAIAVAYLMIDSARPTRVFENSFGQPVPESVSDLQSRLWWFADSGSVYLRFQVDEETFRRLVLADLPARIPEEMRAELPGEGGGQPEWWDFTVAPGWIYYLRVESGGDKPAKKGFYWETEYLAYNPATGRAYYRFLGID